MIATAALVTDSSTEPGLRASSTPFSSALFLAVLPALPSGSLWYSWKGQLSPWKVTVERLDNCRDSLHTLACLMLADNRNTRWNEVLNQLRRELHSLAQEDLLWLQQRSALIQAVQEQIHTLFLAANGKALCHACSGSCCEHGHNHITLINVVAALLQRNLPKPDFTTTCPFLTATGCSLTIAVRPFNCVTFICAAIEDNLPLAHVTEFYRLEKLLRTHYIAVDQRYFGSSLRGLFIGTSRLGAQRLLERRRPWS